MRAIHSTLAVMAVVVTALAGCGETDRPRSREKGVYMGKPDQPLSAEQIEQLKQRGLYQNQ